ncbi:Uncharacterised protein [Klebsiella pneumoniae subsp. ozaenae]|uniref:Uncharacterized protein n=1 Tax=Klebsiella pneumoniae subsp. ozaenae TaxID=574 RepID=A0A378AX20_KLEPO|nr:Uncharacterised protein [Klebsiella pneumoniae subsp. ozaenae]
MLLTLELMLCTDLKRSLATLGELHIGYGPELIEAIGNYVEKNATTPPGLWVRDYKGQQYLTQECSGAAVLHVPAPLGDCTDRR